MDIFSETSSAATVELPISMTLKTSEKGEPSAIKVPSGEGSTSLKDLLAVYGEDSADDSDRQSNTEDDGFDGAEAAVLSTIDDVPAPVDGSEHGGESDHGGCMSNYGSLLSDYIFYFFLLL